MGERGKVFHNRLQVQYRKYVKNPLKSGGEEKMECIGNPAFSKVAGFREYSWTNMEGQVSCHVKLISQKLEKIGGYFI